MLIRSYGLFWSADLVDWYPGSGNRFRMLGRRGQNLPGLRVADFRDQRGLYVLYGNYGPYYVGLARNRGLGDRLKDHMNDHHAGWWTRFSWFGFRRVLQRKDDDGLRELASLASYSAGNLNDVIADMEALLIKALGCADNVAQMNFPKGTEWTQVPCGAEQDRLLDRIR